MHKRDKNVSEKKITENDKEFLAEEIHHDKLRTKCVYRLHHKGESFILKQARSETEEGINEEVINEAREEYKITSKIYNYSMKNYGISMIKPICIGETPDHTYIEAVYEDGGQNLARTLTDADAMKFFRVFKSSLDSLCIIQECGITHFDIKPANMVFKDGITRIIDFGSAKEYKLSPNNKFFAMIEEKNFSVTELFCGPELKKSIIMPGKFDVYCWGMTLYHLIVSLKQYGDKEAYKASKDSMKKYTNSEMTFAQFKRAQIGRAHV